MFGNEGPTKPMRRTIKLIGMAFFLLLVSALGYGGKGYWDALSDAEALRARADELIAHGRGEDSLLPSHLAILISVEDPNFFKHGGVDVATPGAGLTTITQSAAKRLAFERFHPGFGKIRQTGYALGLERRLSKSQILTLWLDTLEMGNGPNGWMSGFHAASFTIYGRSPNELTETEFIRLIAVLIAPATYDLTRNDPRLNERVTRIQRLVARECEPAGVSDVWLEGCQADANK